MSKNKKPAENVVNPIVFCCNELTRKRADEYIPNGDKTLRESVYKVLTDKDLLYRKRRLKTLPLSIYAHEKKYDAHVDLDGVLGCPINDYLCDAFIYPGPNCRVRKLSARATEFLLSLGAPTEDLRQDYRKHLMGAAMSSPLIETVFSDKFGSISDGFYEELIELPLNGHNDYIHVLSSPQMCYVVHKRDPRCGANEYFNIPVGDDLRDAAPLKSCPTREYAADYNNEKTGNIFDVEALLANLWISETLRTCEPCPEPEWSKVASDRPVVLAGKKPLKHSQAYRYIHITDETWKRYSSALTSTREYKNFNVPSWLVRAHYARMHGKTVFIKAHFAYRRKGAVNNVEPVDYIV